MKYSELLQIYKYIEPQIPFRPVLGIVLGSGHGEYAASIVKEKTITFGDIPGFPTTSVSGHKGQFVFAHIAGVPTVIMQGRVHCYEGYTSLQAVAPIRIMKLMGINKLLITNAAGGINPSLKVGQYMAITDHILFNVPSPLIGVNVSELGPRFPDMSRIYDVSLTEKLFTAAKKVGARIAGGTYIQVSGPQFETPAEIRAFGVLGADAVGMSTAIEAVAARHAGIRVCGLSLITNQAAGLTKAAITHEDVNEKSADVIRTTISLLNQAIALIGSEEK